MAKTENASVACPDEHTLSQLLAGTLPAERAMDQENHLAHCSDCLQRAERLKDRDELIDALYETSHGADTPPADESVIEGLIDKLTELPDAHSLHASLSRDEIRSILAPAQQDDELGRLGQYRVLEVLGIGGMGIVFKGEDCELGRLVAIKVMHPKLAASRAASQRFEREACAAAAFEHNHVVTIYHIGEEQGVPYFTMPLLEGESLRRRVEREGRLPTDDILRIGRETADGISAAHERGLLHRDIKPDNVWLLPDGQVKIVDFGLARAVDQASNVTSSGMIVGTPVYMAPEQAQSRNIDERCDLFSLGSLMYHLATGEPPFTGDNLVATLVSVSQDKVTPPRQRNPELSAELNDLILDLLAKNPDDRIQSAREVVQRISKIEAERMGPTVATRAASWRGGITGWAVAAALAFVMFAGALIYVATDRGTLVIDADESVPVTIQDGKVSIRDPETGRQYQLAIGEHKAVPSGQYEIVTTDLATGLQFSAREFSILRGREKKIRAWIQKADDGPAVANATGPGRSNDAMATPATPPPWLAESVATLNVKPGEPLSENSLVQKPAAFEGALSWTLETTGHRSSVNDAAYSRSGLLATAGEDGTIRVWEGAPAKQKLVMVGPGAVRTVSWSEDGQFLASAHPKSICIWMITDKSKLVRRILRTTTRLAFSPDGHYLAFTDDGVQLWDCETGEILPNFGMTGSISRHPWSPDGTALATTTADFGIRIFSIAEQSQIGSMESKGASLATWARGGAYIACLHRYDSAAGTRRGTRPALSCSVEVWDASKYQRIRNFSIGKSTKSSRQLVWGPDEASLLTNYDGVLILWDLATGKSTQQWTMPEVFPDSTSLCDQAPDGTHVAISLGNGIELLDVSSGEFSRISGPNGVLVDQIHPSSGRIAMQGLWPGAGAGVWDLMAPQNLARETTPSCRMLLQPQGKQVAILQPDRELYRASSSSNEPELLDLSIRFLSLPDAQPLGGGVVRIPPSFEAQWSPDGRRLAVFADRYTTVVSPSGVVCEQSFSRQATQRQVRYGYPLPRIVQVWSHDSRFVFHFDGSSTYVINAQTGELAEFRAEIKNGQISWHPRRDLFTWIGRPNASYQTHGPYTAQTWQMAGDSFETVRTDSIPSSGSSRSGSVLGMRFSPSGNEIAAKFSNDGKSIGIWHLQEAKFVSETECSSTRVHEFVWLPDGRKIAFLDDEGVGILNVETQQVKFQPMTQGQFGHTLTCAGETIAVGTINQVNIYDLSLNLQSTLIWNTDPSEQLLIVKSDGNHEFLNKPTELAYVVLHDNVQETLSREEMEERYGWKNDSSQARLFASGARPQVPVPGEPLSPLALVQRPAPIDGVDSWTLEPVDHRSRAVLAEYDPSGTLVATSGMDGCVRIWDTDSRELQKLIVCRGMVWSVAWSSDGTMIAIVTRTEPDERWTTVWNIEADPTLVSLIHAPAWSVHWTAEGRLAVIQDAGSADQDNICEYWDVASGMIVGKTGVGGRGQRRSWSPDSKFLAIIGGSDGDQDVEIWDAAAGTTLHRLAASKCTAAEWSPTGKYLATVRTGLHSEDGANLHHYKVQIWKVANAELVREFTATKLNAALLASVAWSPDEKQMVTHIGSRIDLWDTETGERVGDEPLIETAEVDEQWPQFLSWAVIGKTLLYSDGGVAKLWDFAENTSHRLAGRPEHVALDPDSLSSATGLLTIRAANELFEGKRSIWDLKKLRYITRESEIAAEQVISPDGKLLAQLWHVDRDADKQLVLDLRISELPDMKELHRTRLTATLPPNVTWSPDSSKICLSFNHQYSPSGSLRVLDARKGTLIWRQGEGQETTRMRPGPRSRVLGVSLTPQSVAWSPDSQRLAWWEKGSTIVVSDADTGESLHTLSAAGRPEPMGRTRSSDLVGNVVWSADGHRLAYTIGTRMAIWRIGLELPELLANVTLPTTGNRVPPGLKFSPDGKFVSLREYPDQIHVWNISNGVKKVSWSNNKRRIQWHGWLPDSQRIVFRDTDSLAILKLSDQSIRRLPRHFTRGYNDSTHSGGLIVSSSGGVIELFDDNFEPKLSILPDLDSLQQALFVTPQGQYDITPMAQLPRVVVLENDTQRLMTVQAFGEKYGWKNDPDAVATWSD